AARHAKPDAAIAAGDDGDLAPEIEQFRFHCRISRDSFSALALPDQDQADRAQHRAISGPLDLIDHEAGLRPSHDAGALADPEQSDRERDEADDEKRATHELPPGRPLVALSSEPAIETARTTIAFVRRDAQPAGQGRPEMADAG